MKAYKVKYKHGHFIDIETGKRLIPVQDAVYHISADDNAFENEDVKLKTGDPLDWESQTKVMERKYGMGNYKKILESGTRLFFRIGNSKRIKGDEDRQYIFLCTLLEDLYLYLIKDKSGDDEKHWRLADCKCVLDKCLLGGLTLSEKITASSLNSLFSNTVQFYFSMQRTGAVNALTSFFLYEDGIKITFEGALKKRYKSLARIREEIITK